MATNLNVHPDDLQRERFRKGALAGAEVVAIARHLAGCDQCRAAAANDIDRATLKRNTIKYATTVDAAGLIVVTAGVLTNLDCGYNKVYRANTTTANGSGNWSPISSRTR